MDIFLNWIVRQKAKSLWNYPPFNRNKWLNVLHRFVGRFGCPSRPERYPENNRTEYPRRMSWLADCRVFRPESPPLRYLVPTGDAHTSPKTATRACSPFAAFAAVTMRLPKSLHKSNWIKHAIDHECRERVSSIQRDISALLNRGSNIQAICLQSWKKAVPV